MSGKLLEAARRDIKKILSSKDGFGETITISNPSDGKTLIVEGLHSKHFIQFDSEGNPMNSKNAHISIIESDLIGAEIETRKANGNIDIRHLVVSVSDSTGIQKTYCINENWPSETTGLIVCVLGDYKKKN